jgi:hypothetical protein
MDQSGNNHLLLRTAQSAPPAYNGQHAAADRMRELLARTVHDHIIAQSAIVEGTVARAVEAATADITARIASLEDAVLTRGGAAAPRDPHPAANARPPQRPQLRVKTKIIQPGPAARGGRT